MNWIINNWYLVVGAVAVIAAVVYGAFTFGRLATATQISSLKEWLKYAVTMAEKELGSGTGQLKLRLVYDSFLSKFAWLAKLVSFETFSGYVDEALTWLKSQLESNASVATLVNKDAEVRTEAE